MTIEQLRYVLALLKAEQKPGEFQNLSVYHNGTLLHAEVLNTDEDLLCVVGCEDGRRVWIVPEAVTAIEVPAAR
jgi:hypothetical protein